MSIIDQSSYQKQFSIFCKHLGTDKLVGAIIGDSGAKKVVLGPMSHINITLSDRENLYFLPQVASGYSTADCVKEIKTLFVDVDETSEKSFKLSGIGSLTIERTDKRASQVFFLLDFVISPDEFKLYQLKLAKKFGGDTTVTNPNRLARFSGFTRGIKKKDCKNNIESGLYYSVIGDPKNTTYSRNQIDDLVLEVEDSVATSVYVKTKPPYGIQKVDGLFGELNRDFSIEEGVFYSYFLGKSKGDGTSKILFRFGCWLLDRSCSLYDFEMFAERSKLDLYSISGCDSDEWKKIDENTKKYAKSQKKKTVTIDLPIFSPSQDALFDEFPFLNEAYSDIKKYYFVEDEDKFYRSDDNKLTQISKSIFSSTFSKYFLKRGKDGKFKPRNPTDVVLSRENRIHFNVVSTKTYMPHENIVHRNTLNTWSYPILTENLGEIDTFINHINFLFSDQTTVDGDNLGDLFLDYLCYGYQSKTPATYAYLLYSEKMGVGRSFFTKVLTKLMGDNVSTPTSRIVKEHFTGWHSTKQFSIVEELGEDKCFFDELKPIIGNERVSHREMGKNSTTVDNHCSILMLTNKIKALNVAKGDRRIAVVHMYQQPKDKKYYSDLYDWAEKQENISALSNFFKRRYETLDKLKMRGHAPLTEAKLLVQKITTDTETQNIEEILNDVAFGQNGEFVPQRELIEALYPNVIGSVVKYRNLVASRLSDLNYSPLITGKHVRIGDEIKTVTIYVKTSMVSLYNRDHSSVLDLYKSFFFLKYRKGTPEFISNHSKDTKVQDTKVQDTKVQDTKVQDTGNYCVGPVDYIEINLENAKSTKLFKALNRDTLIEGVVDKKLCGVDNRDIDKPISKTNLKKNKNVIAALALQDKIESCQGSYVSDNTCAHLLFERDKYISEEHDTGFLGLGCFIGDKKSS